VVHSPLDGSGRTRAELKPIKLLFDTAVGFIVDCALPPNCPQPRQVLQMVFLGQLTSLFGTALQNAPSNSFGKIAQPVVRRLRGRDGTRVASEQAATVERRASRTGERTCPHTIFPRLLFIRDFDNRPQLHALVTHPTTNSVTGGASPRDRRIALRSPGGCEPATSRPALRGPAAACSLIPVPECGLRQREA
jgi:hypothetical protein